MYILIISLEITIFDIIYHIFIKVNQIYYEIITINVEFIVI